MIPEETIENAPTEIFNVSQLAPSLGKGAHKKTAPPAVPSAATAITEPPGGEISFFGETISRVFPEDSSEISSLDIEDEQLTMGEISSQLTLSSIPPPAVPPSEVVREIMTSKKEPTVVASFSVDVIPDAKALIEACEAELSLAPDKVRSSRLNFEIANTYETVLDDEALAQKHYQRSYELVPTFIPAIRGARRIMLRQKAYPTAIKLFDAEIQASGNPKIKASLNLTKGRVYEDMLHQQSKARQCYARALELDPGNPCIIEALKQVEIRAKNWASVSQLLESAANAVTTDTAHRAALMAARARINDTRLKEVRTAVELYQNALTLDPVASGAFPALRPLLYAQARWHDLIALLRDGIKRVSDPAIQATSYIQISRIFSERLGDREQAVMALERAIEISPGNVLALEALAEHHAAQGNVKAQVSALIRMVNALEPSGEKIGLLHRIGQLFENELRNPVEAMSWYEQALGQDPTYLPALRALAELYAEHERWESLIHMYADEARATDDTKRRANAHARIADIYELYFANPNEAIAHHTEALSLQPTLETSFKALTRLLSVTKQYKELIALYEQAASQTNEPELAIAYLFKIGALFEDALGRPELAIAAYNRILTISPNHLGAILAKQRAADTAGRYSELVDALKSEAVLVKGKEREVYLLQRIGEVYEINRQDVESALIWYNKVLEIKASHGPALAAVGRICHHLGRWEPLLETYGRELKILTHADAKVALLTKMGDIAAEQLGQSDRAITYYRRAIEIDPTFGPALRALYLKLGEVGNFGALVDVMEKELGGLDDPEAQARLGVRLAEVHEIRRNDWAMALKAYGRSLESLPDFRPALDGLVRTATHLEKWSDLADQLLEMAESANDDVEAIGALFKAGEVLSDYLGDPNRAITAFEGILARQPANLTALISLADLYRDTDSWRILSEVYERLSQVFKENQEKIMPLAELARLVGTGVLEGGEIRNILGAVLAMDPHNLETLTALEDIALAEKDHKLLAHIDGHMVETLDDPIASAVYLGRLAVAVEKSNSEQAINACRTALSADPENLSAIRCLRRLAQRTSDPKLLTEALKREAKWTQKAEAAADLLIQAAAIHLKQLNDPKRAVDHLSAALERCPEHVEAVAHLSELLANDIDELIDIISRAANTTRDGDVKIEYWTMVARLQADSRNNLSGGISALLMILNEKPNHVPTMVQLADLYKRNRQWEEAADVLERVVKQHPPRKQLTEAQLELAKIAGTHLKNYSRAMIYAEDLLKVDPKNTEGLTMLCDMQFRSGNLEAAGQSADRLLRASYGDEERALALFAVGRVKLKRGSRKGAATVLRESISLAGPAGPAGKEYKPLLGKHEPWENYQEALQGYQRRIAADTSPKARENKVLTACELSLVQHEGFRNTRESLAILTQALGELGDHPLLRLNLGLRLLDDKQYDAAIQELRHLIESNPAHANGWRALRAALRAKGKTDEAGFTLAPLVLLDAASAREREAADKYLERRGMVASGSIDQESLAALGTRARGEREATELLLALNDAVVKLYPPNLEQYGLSSMDGIGAGSSHPLRVLADSLARAFGIGDFILYLHNSGKDTVAVELTDPLGIVLPSYVRELRQASQIYILGRVLTYIARGQQTVLTIGRSDLEMLLAAASFKFQYGVSEDQFGAATLERLGKQLYKATSWRGRKPVEEAAQRYAAAGGRFDDILHSMDLAATRAAAILSGDLVAVQEEIRRGDKSLSSLTGEELIWRSKEILDILSFWVSEEAFRFRYRTGIL